MAKFTGSNILDGLDDVEAPPIVKIYTKIIRRKYKRRYLYTYPKHLVPVSASYNEMIVDFLRRPLEEKITIIGESMHIMLTKKQGEVTKDGKN